MNTSNTLIEDRSSRSQMFFKIDVLKNFENFTGKHQCWSFFLIKLQAFSLKKRLKETTTRVFFREICEILKNTCFVKTRSVAASDKIRSEHITKL